MDLLPTALGGKDVFSPLKSAVLLLVCSERNRVVGTTWVIDHHPELSRKPKGSRRKGKILESPRMLAGLSA
jgi:hypothetical protein